jgi:hypothetical protein
MRRSYENISPSLGERRGIVELRTSPSSPLPLTILIKIFGPVLSVGKFHTEQEAIDVANDTTYGLAAGLHSSNRFHFLALLLRLTVTLADQAQCHRVSSALEAGTVRYIINSLLG